MLHRGGLCQAQDAVLRRTVGGQTRRGDDAGTRGDVDDHTASLPAHAREFMLEAQKRTREIDTHHSLPLAGVDIGQGAGGTGDSGVVHRAVEVSEQRHATFHSRLDIRLAGDIDGHGFGRSAVVTDVLRHCRRTALVAVTDEHRRAFACQQFGRRTTDSARRTGYQR